MLGKWLRLGPGERRELLRAGLAVPVIRLGLSALPFDTLDRTLEAIASALGGEDGAAAATVDEAAAVERVRWAVAAVSRRVPGASCLTQALAARMLLGRKGIAAEVRIGVRRDEAGRIAGHAWLEGEAGEILAEGAEGYLTLSRPGDGAEKARR
ncbi:MAG TPA: lasso peptide biosynthesis B2 protein [Polyangia bacterium]|jgi:hypothetical protein|nr:lasso peptide biosynthesis B2 protein [Polyangia bacterium]